MDPAATRTKLLGFGMQLLDGIDPNPDNYVCAGIIHTRTQQIGCLLRLEPNKQAQVRIYDCSLKYWPVNVIFQNFQYVILLQMYRLTVRSSKEDVSIEVCELLMDQF